MRKGKQSEAAGRPLVWRGFIGWCVLLAVLAISGCSGSKVYTYSSLAELKGTEEAAFLVSSATNTLVAPADIAARVAGELEAIRSTFPAVSSIVVGSSWRPDEVLVTLDESGFAALQSGSYTAWDAVNTKYGFTHAEIVTTSLRLVCLHLSGTFNIPLLLPEYRALPHVVSASVNGLIGGRGSICLTIGRKADTFVFNKGWGDCEAGCIHRLYLGFTTTFKGKSVKVTPLGRWERSLTRVMPEWVTKYGCWPGT